MQGAHVLPGFRVDVRGEYIDQDQPHSGTHDVAFGAVHRHHDELETLSRNVITTIDYGSEGPWGVSVVLPYVSVEHTHIHNHHGAKLPESWEWKHLGDVQLMGRYQVFGLPDNDGSLGVRFGLKLPTGSTHLANDEGEEAERSLQPGSGTTDLILGAYYSRLLGTKGSWFMQASWQKPTSQHENYERGSRTGLDLGGTWTVTHRLALHAQLNAQVAGRDAGDEAEPEDTGKRSLLFSPGLSVSLTRDVRIYGFAQIPLYQKVNGVQLVPSKSFALGVSAAF
jgi:hypothetical protein